MVCMVDQQTFSSMKQLNLIPWWMSWPWSGSTFLWSVGTTSLFLFLEQWEHELGLGSISFKFYEQCSVLLLLSDAEICICLSATPTVKERRLHVWPTLPVYVNDISTTPPEKTNAFCGQKWMDRSEKCCWCARKIPIPNMNSFLVQGDHQCLANLNCCGSLPCMHPWNGRITPFLWSLPSSSHASPKNDQVELRICISALSYTAIPLLLDKYRRKHWEMQQERKR